MEVRQIPHYSITYFQISLKHRLPRGLLYPRYGIHLGRFLPSSLLPGRLQRHPNSLGRLPLPIRSRSIHHLRRSRHFHQENRPIPSTNLVWHRGRHSRIRPLHRPPSKPPFLGQNHHLPNHRGSRNRPEFSISLDRLADQSPPSRHRHRNRHLRLRPYPRHLNRRRHRRRHLPKRHATSPRHAARHPRRRTSPKARRRRRRRHDRVREEPAGGAEGGGDARLHGQLAHHVGVLRVRGGAGGGGVVGDREAETEQVA